MPYSNIKICEIRIFVSFVIKEHGHSIKVSGDYA